MSCVAVPLSAPIVTTVASVRALPLSSAVTVTLVFPSSSRRVAGLALRVMSASSSVSVTVASLTLSPTDVVPGIRIVSSPSATPSSVGVTVSVPVPLAVFAGIVMLANVVTV